MGKRRKKILQAMVLIVLLAVAGIGSAWAQTQALPKITIGLDRAQKPGDVAVTLQIILLLTVLSLVPAIVVMMTSFTRIVIVFTFLKQGLGTQQAPPAQVIIGLALFLTFFIMAPVGQQINDQALQPYLKGTMPQSEAYKRAVEPLKDFMLRQTREKDLALFVGLAKMEKPESKADLPMQVVIPAFIINEFRVAFQIGFLLYIPFLVIDLIIASVLMSMGMMMLPPMMISLPLKLVMFVLVDGWYLIVGSLVAGFK
jgi:flagellar biosynthetic protein FliP